MNKEEKRAIWKGFLINMLGVILAIVLTFGVNALWEKHVEKKKTTEMLILVRKELEINKEWFKNQEKTMKEDRYAFKKMLEAKDNWKTLPEDTISAYLSRTFYMSFSQLSTSAWQMFQNSNIIQKMTDKELVIRLTECYFFINKIEDFLTKQYWDKKMNSIVAEPDPNKYFDALMNNKETVFFYTIMSSDNFHFDIINAFPLIDAVINYNILLLDRHGNYRYDMDEKDNEYESFIEASIDSVLHKKDTIK